MARTEVRGGRDKVEWEKKFYGNVRTQMDVFDLKIDELAKVLGLSPDTLSIKLNDPQKFKLWEFCKMCDFLQMDREQNISIVCPKGTKRR